MNRKRVITVLLLVLAGTASMGLTYDKKGKLTWTFLLGTYSSNYDSSGIPKAISIRNPPSDAFLARLGAALPEAKDIRKTNPELIADDVGANLRMKKDGDVYVTFIHEGAGYKNGFGFFTFADGEAPATKADVAETVVFPNASFFNSGGSSNGLKSGDTQKMGSFSAGTNIGFFVAANGFSSSTGLTTTPTGGPPGGDWIFYTTKALNSESNTALRAHTVLLADSISGTVVLGLEDMLRTRSDCDHDFNDVVFTVYSDPPDAIGTEDLAPMPDDFDSDDDGVLDADDDYPEDPDRAFDDVYLGLQGHGTLAFEDSWPLHGDYDFNDLVVEYHYTRVLNAANELVDIVAQYRVLANGSDAAIGFGLAIPGLVPSAVGSATLAIGSGAPQSVTSEAGQSKATWIVFADAAEATGGPGACATFNTSVGCNSGTAPVYTLKITLATPSAPGAVGLPPFDPFLFRGDERGRETHLPNMAPTALADMSLFNTQDDDSNGAINRWYKSFCNLPWALDLPAIWQWPAEGNTILDAYPDFEIWVESGDAVDSEWYLTNARHNRLWTAP